MGFRVFLVCSTHALPRHIFFGGDCRRRLGGSVSQRLWSKTVYMKIVFCADPTLQKAIGCGTSSIFAWWITMDICKCVVGYRYIFLGVNFGRKIRQKSSRNSEVADRVGRQSFMWSLWHCSCHHHHYNHHLHEPSSPRITNDGDGGWW